MKKVRVTQQQAVFYQLYKLRKVDPTAYKPIWELAGPVYVKELGVKGFVSTHVGSRMSELDKNNPALFEIKKSKAENGSTYYNYRIAYNVSVELIKDPALLEFYYKIKNSKYQ